MIVHVDKYFAGCGGNLITLICGGKISTLITTFPFELLMYSANDIVMLTQHIKLLLTLSNF